MSIGDRQDTGDNGACSQAIAWLLFHDSGAIRTHSSIAVTIASGDGAMASPTHRRQPRPEGTTMNGTIGLPECCANQTAPRGIERDRPSRG